MALCKHCHQPKQPAHRHCGGCGTLLTQGAKHAEKCPRVYKALKPGQVCPKCQKLLAAGAHCPTHGAPTEEAA